MTVFLMNQLVRVVRLGMKAHQAEKKSKVKNKTVRCRKLMKLANLTKKQMMNRMMKIHLGKTKMINQKSFRLILKTKLLYKLMRLGEGPIRLEL